MKVTKLIKEYVKKSVEKVMPYREEITDEIQVEYKALKKNIKINHLSHGRII